MEDNGVSAIEGIYYLQIKGNPILKTLEYKNIRRKFFFSRLSILKIISITD